MFVNYCSGLDGADYFWKIAVSKKNPCWSMGRSEEGSGRWARLTNHISKDKSRNISSFQILGTILTLQSRTAHDVWSDRKSVV